MAIYKNKNQIRKEVAQLIDNIKQHSDSIAEHKRIPQIELEFITAKIKKLYEKSIVFNYLNAMSDEPDPTTYTEKSIIDVEVPVFEKMPVMAEYHEEKKLNEKAVPFTSMPIIVTVPSPSEQKMEMPSVEVAVEKVTEQKTATPKESPFPANSVTPSDATKAAASNNLKDLKSYIGINDKLQFISMLFKGNSADYENAIILLNGATILATAKKMTEDLKHTYQWDKDGDAYLNLISLIELRYR